MKHEATNAAGEFQRILDHRVVDPFSSFYVLAHLGRARAAAQTGDEQTARTMYGEFFTLRANADEDLPLLHQARAEYARLGRKTTH